ncbi:MAG TPA: hypothetical protein VMT42_07225 [candidate division Zixibacteria bacterium]|nr:hypothetical protein [candidate division Zixibacteria bacterium]
MSELARIIVEDFLKSSWSCVEALVGELASFKPDAGRRIRFFHFKNGRRNAATFDSGHFFLRASVEYSNPQLTVEEVQGIVAARLLEVCGNHFYYYGLRSVDDKDVNELCEMLRDPSQGVIVPFLLNTDEIEPDRYSMNPLKESIVNSGQSAFPCARVKTEALEIDKNFAQKYDGSLICKEEIGLIGRHLKTCNNSYVDMVDAVKYEQLEKLSQAFGINLSIYSIRMPLTPLSEEKPDGLLHQIIRETHSGYESIECVYKCMGRSMKNLTTLLTVPHSIKGYASKRAARGRIYFDGAKLKSIKVDYKTVLLYPNAIDPGDVSVAKADDAFNVDGDKLANYDFKETPSSPQFFLYSLASPENAVLWHGIGAFGASELLRSYATIRVACAKDLIIKGLSEKHGLATKIPLQFNLVPKHMWFHPVHRNIDASIGCVQNMKDMADLGMKMERLQTDQYIRA